MDYEIVTEVSGINKALYQVTHGLYVLTSKNAERINGQCLDSLMQVTNMPPRIAISIGKRSLTYEMIVESGLFIANAINREDAGWRDKIKLYGFQSGRNVEKFTPTVSFELSKNGVPILKDAIAFYECHLIKDMTLDLGTHSLFVGEVDRAGTRNFGEPLTYNYYRDTLKKGE
jgi:flavin reductase (DIM6/NTAB) family NADH-FMN oxidoreductase RutF